MVPVFDIYDILHEQQTGISSNEDVLDWIVNSVSDGLQWCQRDPVALSPEDGLVAGWEDFCEAVKHKTRYLFFEAPRQALGGLPEVAEEPYYVHPSDLLEQLAELVRLLLFGRVFVVRGLSEHAVEVARELQEGRLLRLRSDPEVAHEAAVLEP